MKQRQRQCPVVYVYARVAMMSKLLIAIVSDKIRFELVFFGFVLCADLYVPSIRLFIENTLYGLTMFGIEIRSRSSTNPSKRGTSRINVRVFVCSV